MRYSYTNTAGPILHEVQVKSAALVAVNVLKVRGGADAEERMFPWKKCSTWTKPETPI